METLLKVTTATGRVYLVDYDNGWFYRKAKNPGAYSGGWVKTWHLMVGDTFEVPNVMQETDDWTFSSPQVGKYMYIGGKDVWYLSTRVVSVEPDKLDNPFLG